MYTYQVYDKQNTSQYAEYLHLETNRGNIEPDQIWVTAIMTYLFKLTQEQLDKSSGDGLLIDQFMGRHIALCNLFNNKRSHLTSM